MARETGPFLLDRIVDRLDACHARFEFKRLD
jgi:hypothetical protein